MSDCPNCHDFRTDCNNRTPREKCIALSETSSFKNCPFYCARVDTNPEDMKYHVNDKGKIKTRRYLENLI